MEQTENNRTRNLWMAIGILVAVGAVVGIVVYALAISSTKPEASSTKSPAPWPRVATKEEVTQSLTDLETTLKQATSDQAAAEATLNDGDKQIKVGN